jgi:hypothetical protein
MLSLLSKEIETHYSSNDKTNLLISSILDENNKNLNNQDKKIKQNKEIECKLNVNNFNPMKNSPPNDWQIRLEKRLKEIDNKILIQCKI